MSPASAIGAKCSTLATDRVKLLPICGRPTVCSQPRWRIAVGRGRSFVHQLDRRIDDLDRAARVAEGRPLHRVEVVTEAAVLELAPARRRPR